jgi:single-strand DNA-binding protein
MNETMVTVIGNVISDVRGRRTSDGTKVVSFRMASNERRYDRDAEQWVDGDRLYVTVTCWRRLAAGVAASLVKGDPVLALGRLHTRSFEQEGQRRYVTELEAYAVGPDLARCSAELQRTRRPTEEARREEPATADLANSVGNADEAASTAAWRGARELAAVT